MPQRMKLPTDIICSRMQHLMVCVHIRLALKCVATVICVTVFIKTKVFQMGVQGGGAGGGAYMLGRISVRPNI